MEAAHTQLSSRIVPALDLLEQMRRVPIFSQVKEEDLSCLGDVELIEAPKGAVLVTPGEQDLSYWITLSGSLRMTKLETDGTKTLMATFESGDAFGEVPLLTGATATAMNVTMTSDGEIVRVDPAGFWRLMGTCPMIRAAVLENVGRRMGAYQVMTRHREKLVTLGTLAAGLMHELNNPGAAARRAASQLRENLTRLQQISLRFSERDLTYDQKRCLAQLQAEALKDRKPQPMSSLEQSDAEQELAEWLEDVGVENAWKMAPTLVQVGWECNDITCAQHAFPREILSDALNWLEALISSLQLVGTVEESVARVTDLVMAVKKYAYADKNRAGEIDIHDSIHSTLTILAHKFRHKQMTVEKSFAQGLPTLHTTGTGLNQVWTNILDNAIDASPEGGKLSIRTWKDASFIYVGIGDQGPGIPEDLREHIFEPFFTTKPVGVGTGLGLDIAHRIVVGQFNGDIQFESHPGKTEFIVRLPLETPAEAPAPKPGLDAGIS